MSFNYEDSIWGRGEANLSRTSPTSFRLRQALFALRDIPTNGKILEVGCGAGQFIRAIKKAKPGSQCFGCDISQKAVDEARESGGQVEYTVCDEFQIPYDNDSLDAVLIFDVLEHAQSVDKLLVEIHRILKKDGVFYCFVPCEGDLLSFWAALRAAGVGHDLTKKHAGHINFFSRKSLLNLLKENNFVPAHIRYSEHIFGQAVGVVAFFMMERRVKRSGVQINNEQYFTEQKSKLGFIGKLIGNVVNFVINLESTIFSKRPSPNIHVISKKD